MAQHTAGPWKIVEGKYYCAVRTDDGVIADMRYVNGHMPNPADAALIAAAPELLAALKYVIEYHREHDSGEGELFGLDYVTTCIAAVRTAEPDFILKG